MISEVLKRVKTCLSPECSFLTLKNNFSKSLNSPDGDTESFHSSFSLEAIYFWFTTRFPNMGKLKSARIT